MITSSWFCWNIGKRLEKPDFDMLNDIARDQIKLEIQLIIFYEKI